MIALASSTLATSIILSKDTKGRRENEKHERKNGKKEEIEKRKGGLQSAAAEKIYSVQEERRIRKKRDAMSERKAAEQKKTKTRRNKTREKKVAGTRSVIQEKRVRWGRWCASAAPFWRVRVLAQTEKGKCK